MLAVRSSPRCVSFGNVSDDGPSSSPCPSSSSASPLPLGPARLIASTRRGVVFSPRNDTKYFKAGESIAECSVAPVRAYPESSSPCSSRIDSPGPSSTPARSILKQRVHQIRLAATVEEGTMQNKEPARLLVTGPKPRLVARDSFQLAQLRRAACDGEVRSSDDVPSSDDSVVSADAGDGQEPRSELSEEEEEVESMCIASLVDVLTLREGAQDLLTLEEAYNTLTLHLRDAVPVDKRALSADDYTAIRAATQPIRDEAPAVVRAIQRDLSRLLGKAQASEFPSEASSPFRHLVPYRDTTPTQRGRLTPASSSPERAARAGYTEAEVRYRREAAGVGQAALRFLSFAFHTPHIFGCFSDADVQAILDQVMVVPRTPSLPTPNPKRTYWLAILVLSHLQVSVASVLPIKDKIARAIEISLADGVTPVGNAQSQTKKEAFGAVANLVATYPTVFFACHADWLPACIRAMSSPTAVIRNKGSAAAAAFAAAKLRLLTQAEKDPIGSDGIEALAKTKAMVARMETTVVAHFKTPLRGKTSLPSTAEKRTEWNSLETMFRSTVGAQDEVAWACATWSVVATLLGASYNAAPFASGMDHIIDPSTNAVRPTLATIAWQHAIHAYLSASSSTFVTEGRVARAWSPFIASSYQDVGDRLRTIQVPVDVALRHALDPSNVSRVLASMPHFNNETRCLWERTEKTKKLAWMVTTGESAAAIVYAYTGMALRHEEPPATERTAASGLPSSDGIVAEVTPETCLPRLDNTFDKVVLPLLKSFFVINGVDALKTHGWAIFEAITSSRAGAFDMDRLLCSRYLSGEVFDAVDGPALVGQLDVERVQPAEIPGWGALWVAKRLGKLLLLFDEAFDGIRGVNDLNQVEWVSGPDGIVLLPATLSRTWANLLTALASIPNTATPLYMAGLQAVVRHLVGIFERDPNTYVPVCLLQRDGKTSLPVDSVRLAIATHLYTVAAEILGPALGTVRMSADMQQHPRDAAIASTAFGADEAGATAAGALLGQLLRTKVFAAPLLPQVRVAAGRLFGAILDAGAVGAYAAKLLGDMTNGMPWLFEEHETLHLDVWRLLVIDLQPSTTSSTNHTGALLVNLLSNPFRGKQLTSLWHQGATHEDFAAWRALLDVAVLRFRARRVGSNLGVLESLAAHLADYIEAAPQSSSSTITLSCLAAAAAHMRFVQPEHHHASHYSINENFVPVDFLSLVGQALAESYPQATDSLPASQQAISPAVTDVLDNLTIVFAELPAEFVYPVLEPLQGSLALWMADAEGLAPALASTLDNLYVALLDALTRANAAGHITASTATVNALVDVYAPRLSVAQSHAVAAAFQTFWRHTFQDVSGLDYSDDVAGFLLDVMAAVPGMITARDLSTSGESLSIEESQAKYPHAYALRVETAAPEAAEPELTADVTMAEPTTEVLPTAAYDADVSQESPARETSPSPSDALVSETDSEQQIVDEVSLDSTSDVFGPALRRRGRPRKRGRAKTDVSRTKKATPGNANASRVPDTPAVPPVAVEPTSDVADNSDPDAQPVMTGERPSVFQSATRWLAKVPSIGSLFSPNRPSDDPMAALAPSPFAQPVSVGVSAPVNEPVHGAEDAPTAAAEPEVSIAHTEVPAESTDASVAGRAAETDLSAMPQDSLAAPRQARRSKRRELERTQSKFTSAPTPRLTRSGSLKRALPEAPAEQVDDRRKRQRSRDMSQTPVKFAPVPEALDDEDPLLLSPETASKTRREEEGAIAHHVLQGADGELPSGIFDDDDDMAEAAGAVARAMANMASSSSRTVSQQKVLAMVREAARMRGTVETLSFDDVLDLNTHIELLRAAVTANLTGRAAEHRGAQAKRD